MRRFIPKKASSTESINQPLKSTRLNASSDAPPVKNTNHAPVKSANGDGVNDKVLPSYMRPTNNSKNKMVAQGLERQGSVRAKREDVPPVGLKRANSFKSINNEPLKSARSTSTPVGKKGPESLNFSNASSIVSSNSRHGTNSKSLNITQVESAFECSATSFRSTTQSEQHGSL